MTHSRRDLIAAGLTAGVGAGLAARPASARTSPAKPSYDVAVIGAGVFGLWTAWRLQQAGKRVLLIDAWGPGHARASSGGESRLTRTAYGADEIYSRMAWDSLKDWKWLSERSALPVFHNLGVLFFAASEDAYFRDSFAVHKRLGLPLEQLGGADLRRRYPQIDWSGIDIGMYEPDMGALMARRSLQTLKAIYARKGDYRQAAIRPPRAVNGKLRVETLDGEEILAGQFCFACGPWLPKLFPELLGERITPTRQEIFFFATPPGDDRFAPGKLPGWADFNAGDLYYGFPDLEGRGFKIANDVHGEVVDPDTLERRASDKALADARRYMKLRFPTLAGQPLNESRVCQYENSSSGDFLIDRHPEWSQVLLLGGGSGHGFKHGPAVGKAATGMLLAPGTAAGTRFSLATKARTRNRAVH